MCYLRGSCAEPGFFLLFWFYRLVPLAVFTGWHLQLSFALRGWAMKEVVGDGDKRTKGLVGDGDKSSLGEPVHDGQPFLGFLDALD